MARKKIDETMKQGVINGYKDGVSRKKIAEKFGISLSSVSRIIKEKRLPPSKETIEPKEKTERQKKIEELERRIAQLEKKILEREFKKACEIAK